jgi:hypothetical protein
MDLKVELVGTCIYTTRRDWANEKTGSLDREEPPNTE